MSDLALFDTDMTVPVIGSTFGTDAARTRRSDAVESHRAADSNNVPATRAVVLAAFHERKFFADHELVAFLAGTKFTPQRIRTARSELSNPEGGLLVLAGYSVPTPNGGMGRVWTLRKDAA